MAEKVTGGFVDFDLEAYPRRIPAQRIGKFPVNSLLPDEIASNGWQTAGNTWVRGRRQNSLLIPVPDQVFAENGQKSAKSVALTRNSQLISLLIVLWPQIARG